MAVAPGETPQSDGQEPRESQSARLRRQRDEARSELNSLRSEIAELRGLIQANNDNGTTQTRERKSSWEDLTDDEMLHYATSEELAGEKPHVAINAAIKYAERLFQKNKSALAEEVRQNVLTEIQSANQNQDVLSKIKRDFGDAALDRDSDLFQLANSKYVAWQKRYGPDKVNQMPDYKYWAVKEAAEELGHSKPKETTKTEPESEIAVKQPKGPPAEARTEGGSAASAEALNQVRSLLDKGDWRNAYKLKVKSLFG